MAVKKSKKAPAKGKKIARKITKKVKLEKPKNGVQYTQPEFYECMQGACELESKKQSNREVEKRSER